MWAGMRLALSSPYLLGICAYLFFLTTTATFLYLEQTRLVGEQVASAQGRTRLFAVMDLVVNVFTFLAQLLVTGPMISRFGLASALVLLPTASVVGFAVIGAMPSYCLHSLYDRAARWRVCHREARSRGTLYRPQPRRKVQGQELHRHSGLARGRCRHGMDRQRGEGDWDRRDADGLGVDPGGVRVGLARMVAGETGGTKTIGAAAALRQFTVQKISCYSPTLICRQREVRMPEVPVKLYLDKILKTCRRHVFVLG